MNASIPFSKLKVLIVDDHPFFRIGLKTNLELIPQIKKISEAENGHDALKLLQTNQYDIVFLDIEMPVIDGIEVVRKMRQLHSKTKIIVLSMHASEQYILEMHALEIDSYLLKDTNLTEVKRAIENVLEGQYYHCQPVRDILYTAFIKKDRGSSVFAKNRHLRNDITNREIEILKLICQQYSTSEIATMLFISENTVKFHRENLLDKTGSRNLAGLVIYAIKNNLFEI